MITCPCHGSGLIEVKCPYSHRNSSVVVAARNDKSFCLKESQSGDLELNRDHDYFYQIQAQMSVTKRDFCLFIVWTTVDAHVSIVQHDKEFCDVLVQKCQAAFKLVILPELIGEYFTKTRHLSSVSDAERRICSCRESKENSRVVHCASGRENCLVWEFHEECIKKTQSRITNRWRCDSCKVKSTKKNVGEKKVLKARNH